MKEYIAGYLGALDFDKCIYALRGIEVSPHTLIVTETYSVAEVRDLLNKLGQEAASSHASLFKPRHIRVITGESYREELHEKQLVRDLVFLGMPFRSRFLADFFHLRSTLMQLVRQYSCRIRVIIDAEIDEIEAQLNACGNQAFQGKPPIKFWLQFHSGPLCYLRWDVSGFSERDVSYALISKEKGLLNEKARSSRL